LTNPDVLGHIAFRTLPRLESGAVRLSAEQLALVRQQALRCGADLCVPGERQPA
jgi:hypothetical protein